MRTKLVCEVDNVNKASLRSLNLTFMLQKLSKPFFCVKYSLYFARACCNDHIHTSQITFPVYGTVNLFFFFLKQIRCKIRLNCETKLRNCFWVTAKLRLQNRS